MPAGVVARPAVTTAYAAGHAVEVVCAVDVIPAWVAAQPRQRAVRAAMPGDLADNPGSVRRTRSRARRASGMPQAPVRRSVKSPSELVPVRPVLEFSMVDLRFVAESDALSEFDQRPNLTELSPTEVEALIQNLFAKMGAGGQANPALTRRRGRLRRLGSPANLRRQSGHSG